MCVILLIFMNVNKTRDEENKNESSDKKFKMLLGLRKFNVNTKVKVIPKRKIIEPNTLEIVKLLTIENQNKSRSSSNCKNVKFESNNVNNNLYNEELMTTKPETTHLTECDKTSFNKLSSHKSQKCLLKRDFPLSKNRLFSSIDETNLRSIINESADRSVELKKLRKFSSVEKNNHKNMLCLDYNNNLTNDSLYAEKEEKETVLIAKLHLKRIFMPHIQYNSSYDKIKLKKFSKDFEKISLIRNISPALKTANSKIKPTLPRLIPKAPKNFNKYKI
jgi:hypothetical protein